MYNKTLPIKMVSGAKVYNNFTGLHLQSRLNIYKNKCMIIRFMNRI